MAFISLGTAGYFLIASIVASLASAGVGMYQAHTSAEGAKAANQANKELFQQEMAFNSAEAQKNRDFQLMMSNTAHQREVKDLKAAGLNPWLSVGGGANTTHTNTAHANSPSMKNTAPDLSALASALGSVKDLAMISVLANKYGGKGSSKRASSSSKGYNYGKLDWDELMTHMEPDF